MLNVPWNMTGTVWLSAITKRIRGAQAVMRLMPMILLTKWHVGGWKLRGYAVSSGCAALGKPLNVELTAVLSTRQTMVNKPSTLQTY
jgi:hypothetical protein